MNLKTTVVASLSIATLGAASIAVADHHDDDRRGEMRGEHHDDERHEEHRGEMDRRDMHRMPPPRWAPHAPGMHPHYVGRGHAVRVLSPRMVRWGNHGTWRHWAHPEFNRPHYYWEWNQIHQVSCVAEDSYGDQYPVAVNTFNGFGAQNMTALEDDALDRCYQESGGDTSCYLATCTHF